MIRKVRFLGTALIAALALSAVGASAASAEGVYSVSSTPATGTATSELGNDIFTTEAGNVECESSFSATQNEKTASTLTVKATYTNCKAFGLSATVEMMSCDYLFTTPETNGGVHLWKAKVHVKCSTAGDAITITAGTCKVSVGAQSPAGQVDIKNTTTTTNPHVNADVDVKATVTGISYTVTQDGFLCPFNGAGAKTGATYTQKNEVTFHVPGIDIAAVHP